MKRIFKNSGMSFLELMVSMAIFSVIIASTFTAIFTGRLYWRVGTAQLDVQQQARQAISYMVKELRQTRNGDGNVGGGSPVAILENLPADGNSYTSVTFRIPQDTDNNGTVLNVSGQIVDWSEKTTYCLVNNQIIRQEKDSASPLDCVCEALTDKCKVKVLANNVNTLLFSRSAAAPALITIEVTARKNIKGATENIDFILSSQVKLRN